MKKLFFLIITCPVLLLSQVFPEVEKKFDDGFNLLYPKNNHIPEVTTPWNQKIRISGYVQTRYNELLQTNENLEADQADKSWGGHKGFSLRRVRVKIAGQLNDYVYVYLQPDFGGTKPSLRDAYMDIALDKNREFRFRIGQSKIPYSFENLQSSQNRISLDRNDALNSAIKNERDLGVLFYWTPKKVQERYSFLVKSGLKGSGNYGVFGLGVYNGQFTNTYDLNANKHLVARLNYPFQFKNGQILELGINGYTGKHVIMNLSNGVGLKNNNIVDGNELLENTEYLDERIGGSFVFYPQPIGFQAEYNYGNGPEFNPNTKTIETGKLSGGYAMVIGRFSFHKKHIFFPFIKYQFYKGGKKQELDARRYDVKDLEIGMEWQPNPFFELNLTYTISNREYLDFVNPINRQIGNLLRIQAQINF